MEKRLPIFMLLAVAILVGSQLLSNWLWPTKRVDKKNGTAAATQGTGTQAAQQGTGTVAAAQGTVTEAVAAGPQVEPDPQLPEQFVTLGSLDRSQGARMLVTFTNRGAAIARVELNSDRFRAQDDATGYLGHLFPVAASEGVRVQVVGPGTPAAAAGLKAGDVIAAVGTARVSKIADLNDALRQHRPQAQVQLSVRRGDQKMQLAAILARRPLELIRPEWQTHPLDSYPDGEAGGKRDPFSLLLTLSKVGNEELKSDQTQLPGIDLHAVPWKISAQGAHHVEFSRRLPLRKLTVVKRFELAQVPQESLEDPNFKAYHVTVTIEVRRDADAPIDVAYRLDGPNGLPTEGWWYLNKISRNWSASGMRDIAANVDNLGPQLVNCSAVYKKEKVSWDTVNYVGVDTPYFSSILIPQKTPEVQWFYQVRPILVGALPTDQANRELHHENPRLANTSCQIVSKTVTISRNEPLKHQYQLFAGPKQRDLLLQYTAEASTYPVNLAELIYYGWQIWAWFAKPLSYLLHFFAQIPGVNYGLAIILLTVLVRLCMFPMSRQQALGAQKMQLLAPEMKKINEKYKNELEKKHKAMQELYRKHNYNPLSGCLPMFIQLPIFIGLYRALAVNIELRQAPLISDTFGWATNLAAPDMLFRWSGFMPSFIVSYMGPYFNLLPVLTVILFIWQQKMFMPPPADENAALQQKMMQYMMIFMGYMFFTVPSGLCIYFIASSLWGIAERKLLPKTQAAAGTEAAPAADPAAVAATGESPAAARRRKRRNRK